MHESDQELIQKLISNIASVREKSWEQIYVSYYPMVKDMVLKHSGSEEDATDVFQDGLVVLRLNLINGSFRSESTISTYLFSVCKNLWLKEYNKRTKQAMLQPEFILEARQNVDYLINVEIVTLLMNELQEDCRKILTEYYYHNRSMAELKEMFNVNSIQAAKNKKWRCLNYLVKLFKERGVTPNWS